KASRTSNCATQETTMSTRQNNSASKPDLSERLLALAADYLAPTLTMLGALLAWEALVYFKEIPPYLLPAPSLILKTLVTDFGSLVPSLLFTIRLTVLSLC